MKSSYWNCVLLLIVAVVLYALTPTTLEAREPGDQPNIVLIMADDLGYECIGANGGTSYETPFLDQLAETGVRFEHCHSQPLCTPSRAKIMTGISNVRNYVKFGLLDPSQTTFAHLFREEGYKTCVVGKWQLQGGLEGPDHFGFDEYALWQLTRRPSRYPSVGLEINGELVDLAGEGSYGPDVVSDYACDFIDRNKDEPFLVYYPMILTHCPFEPTPDSDDWDPNSPGSPSYKGDAKYFADMVAYMDKIVGKIDAQLEAAGVRDNTLLLFTGDNGTDTPVVSMMGDLEVVGAKGQMHDWGNRVPLIAHWPGGISEGVVTQDLVEFSDVLPTICAAADIDVPESIQIDGRSFLPTLRSEEGERRDWLHIWYSRTGTDDKAKEFTRNQRYKLYTDGRFFDVTNDVMEQSPLAEEELDAELLGLRAMLQDALDQYADVRGNAL
jgi:arylsulfatase A